VSTAFQSASWGLITAPDYTGQPGASPRRGTRSRGAVAGPGRPGTAIPREPRTVTALVFVAVAAWLMTVPLTVPATIGIAEHRSLHTMRA
jgi:hypothetical protein